MQFTLAITRPVLDLGRLEDLLLAADPAALVGLDRQGTTLRMATSLGTIELCTLFEVAGYPIDRDALHDVPSGCCGGCGG